MGSIGTMMARFSAAFARRARRGENDLQRMLHGVKSVADLERFFSEWARTGGETVAGVNITHDTALRVAAVLACARCIAEGLAQVPFRVMQVGVGGRDEARTHPLWDLLKTAPNDWMTSFELRETAAMHAVLTGTAYAYVVRSPVGGTILELLPLPPNAVTPRRNGWDIAYSVTFPDGQHKVVPADSMLVWRGPSWDTWTGLDIVRLAATAIGIAKAGDDLVARTFANGGKPAGVLSTAMPMSAEQQKQMREDWTTHYAGPANSGKTVVLGGDWKWTPLAMSLVDSQMDAQRRIQIEEVCRIFRVMPLMIGYTDKAATYASVEQMLLAHIVHTLGPWYERVEQSTNRQLLTRDERRDGLYCKFGVNALMRGAMKDRIAFYQGMFAIGAMSPNEVRALEDMNPYEGGETYRVPMNMEDPANPSPADDDGDGEPGGVPGNDPASQTVKTRA